MRLAHHWSGGGRLISGVPASCRVCFPSRGFAWNEKATRIREPIKGCSAYVFGTPLVGGRRISGLLPKYCCSGLRCRHVTQNGDHCCGQKHALQKVRQKVILMGTILGKGLSHCTGCIFGAKLPYRKLLMCRTICWHDTVTSIFAFGRLAHSSVARIARNNAPGVMFRVMDNDIELTLTFGAQGLMLHP